MSGEHKANQRLVRDWMQGGVPVATLTLNTAFELFCDWLESHVGPTNLAGVSSLVQFMRNSKSARHVGTAIPYEDEEGAQSAYLPPSNCRLTGPTWSESDDNDNSRQYSIDATLCYSVQGGGAGIPISDVITFGIMRLALDRIEVVAICSVADLVCVTHLYHLLERIAELWPEASDAVADYATELNISETGPPAQRAQTLTIAKHLGGRPRNLDDDWACREVWEKGRKPREVRPEWEKRIGTRFGTLADPHETFRKAVSKKRWDRIQELEAGRN